MADKIATFQINYPPDLVPRWGHGKPGHPVLAEIFEAQRAEYCETLASFVDYADAIIEFGKVESVGPLAPNLRSPWLPGLDGVTLYCLIRKAPPAQFVEIGSGDSTKIAHRARLDGAADTRFTSIDPQPRSEIDQLVDEVVRTGLESLNDYRRFETLRPGDMVFFDGSHRCLTNSDVTVFFLEVLPRLPAGVLVQIHDIFLPYDYPPHWRQRLYSEQYLLACYLLARSPLFEIVLPNAFISHDSELVGILRPRLWSRPGMQGVSAGGGSFWLRTLGA